MQTRVSQWLRERERDGKIGAGTTLHDAPASPLCRLVEAQRCQRRGSCPADRRQVGRDGLALHAASKTKFQSRERSTQLGKDGA